MLEPIPASSLPWGTGPRAQPLKSLQLLLLDNCSGSLDLGASAARVPPLQLPVLLRLLNWPQDGHFPSFDLRTCSDVPTTFCSIYAPPLFSASGLMESLASQILPSPRGASFSDRMMTIYSGSFGRVWNGPCMAATAFMVAFSPPLR